MTNRKAADRRKEIIESECYGETGVLEFSEIVLTCFNREIILGHSTGTKVENLTRVTEVHERRGRAGIWIDGTAWTDGFGQTPCGSPDA